MLTIDEQALKNRLPGPFESNISFKETSFTNL